MKLNCDLFCRVVDNLGDAGVCWRLARQLAIEHGWSMRLWIDDPRPLTGLRPGIDPSLDRQQVDGVQIRRWPATFADGAAGDVVIEAFACDLPPAFVAAMATRARPPVWLNLEYLSAEDWVAGCHGLPSPQPTVALTKHFFFPGFTAATGGLIRESSLARPLPATERSELIVSLFCYDNAALPDLLAAWAAGPEPVVCLVTDGLARRQVERWLAAPLPLAATVRQGRLTLKALPFLAQPEYDRLLADADLNFVRGEDSLVRAQWAERPFVWQVYPQADAAHWRKLTAFLHRYGQRLPEPARLAVGRFWQAWNGRGSIAAAWPEFRAVLPTLTKHGANWATEIAAGGDLAQNLVRFCRERI